MEGVGEREMSQEPTLPSLRPSISAPTTTTTATTERSASAGIVQVFWFFLVFLFVHHVLKALRVGPILGFFGATGPEAIGYWNAMEAMVDFLLFRLFWAWAFSVPIAPFPLPPFRLWFRLPAYVFACVCFKQKRILRILQIPGQLSWECFEVRGAYFLFLFRRKCIVTEIIGFFK